jgi:peptide/nickel transport system substrate-binding protein
MLSYFTCAELTTDPEAPGYNDANWCSEEYDALYEQQKVELDETRRREIVAEMLRLFNRESTYLVLLQDADTQAYRTDRFEGWLQQPEGTGPVLFTNSSPTYANLTVIGAEAPEEPAIGSETGSETGSATGGDEAVVSTAPADTGGATDEDDDGGSNTGLIVGIVIAAAAVLGVGAWALKRKSSADDRE